MARATPRTGWVVWLVCGGWLCVAPLRGFAAETAVLVGSRAKTQGMLYATGFERNELTPFVPGNLAGQGGAIPWRVSEGAATVESLVSAHGGQGVEAMGASYGVALTAAVPVVWIDAWVRDPGSANPPLIPTTPAGAMVYFSADRGLLALDGDGNGAGVFVQVAPDWPTNRFARLSLRMDFPAKTYEVWVDGTLRRAGLRFKDNSVQGLAGLDRHADLTSYLDDVSVSTLGLDKDTDGDGLSDLDETKFYGTSPVTADTDGDGMGDFQEVLAGTDPANAASNFAVGIELDAEGARWVSFATAPGRSYTLQRRTTLDDGVAWENVPGLSGVTGDGLERRYRETEEGATHFYRCVIASFPVQP